MKKLIIALTLIFPLVASGIVPQTASANTECDYGFYELNTISIYDPCDMTCTSRDSVETDRPEILNRDYRGRSILTSAQLATVRQYTPTYQAAAKETQVPWQMIAALHFRETGLKKVNPANGFGVYQDIKNLGGEYPAGNISDAEFLKQSIWAGNQLKSKASKPERLASGDIKQIKEAFFGFNNTDGRGALYLAQAKSLGYSDSQAYEGSPYVMNKADEKRNANPSVAGGPTQEGPPWGEVFVENGPLVYPAGNTYGAFVVFAALAGIDQSGCTTGLVDGGMDLETAKAFMQLYINSPDSINYIGGAARDSSYGPLANCTSFSNYFINKYTTKTNFSGSGWNLVTGYFLPNNPDVRSGVNTPEVYAVFSTPKSANHTGVILGMDAAAGTMIVGDQGYNKPLRLPKEVTIESYQKRYGPMTYAYVGDFLKEDL